MKQRFVLNDKISTFSFFKRQIISRLLDQHRFKSRRRQWLDNRHLMISDSDRLIHTCLARSVGFLYPLAGRVQGRDTISPCFDRHCEHLIIVKIICLLNSVVFPCVSYCCFGFHQKHIFFLLQNFFCLQFVLFYVAFILPLRTNKCVVAYKTPPLLLCIHVSK